MPKERSGGPGLDQNCEWEKYRYDMISESLSNHDHCPLLTERRD